MQFNHPYVQKVFDKVCARNAGEKEYLAWLSRKDTGVPLNDSLKKTIKALKEEYKLDSYTFNF